jgi:hypothetical protein
MNEEKAKQKWLEVVGEKGWKGYTRGELEAFLLGFKSAQKEAGKLKQKLQRTLKIFKKAATMPEDQLCRNLIYRIEELLKEVERD